MPTTNQVYAYLRKKYPDHGRRFYLMDMKQLYAIYYKMRRGEKVKKGVGR